MRVTELHAALTAAAKAGRPVPEYVLAGLAEDAQAYQRLDALNWVVACGWGAALPADAVLG